MKGGIENPRRSAGVGETLVFALLSLLTLAVGCGHRTDPLLARVGNRTIRASAFQERFQDLQRRLSLPDNLLTRRNVLDQMIEEELLLTEARRRGYDHDSLGLYELERIRIQELLNAYLEAKVFPRVSATEGELVELYRRLNTRVRARHLYAASRVEAESLLAALRAGGSFEDLAKRVFRDPVLRENGGDLGYFTVGEMDPAFEEAAFTAPIGEIVGPIRTAQGYSILRVEDRVANPLLIESEYAKHRSKLLAYCLRQKRKLAARRHADSLRAFLQIRFQEAMLDTLLRALKERKLDEPEALFTALSRRDLWHQVVVTWRLGTWDVRTFAEHARFTDEAQQSWIRNRENLEDFIAGLVIRAYILREARKSGLHRSKSYREAVRRKQENYLLERFLQELEVSRPIPHDTLVSFYRRHRDRFRSPERVRLAAIVVADSGVAEKIRSLLLSGADFADMARRYSIDRHSAELGGMIGAFARAELGPFGERLFGLREGEWAGPWRRDGRFFFFRSLGREQAAALSFEEAKPEIERTLRPFWRQRLKEDLLREIRSRVEVVVYSEKLRALPNVQSSQLANEGS